MNAFGSAAWDVPAAKVPLCLVGSLFVAVVLLSSCGDTSGPALTSVDIGAEMRLVDGSSLVAPALHGVSAGRERGQSDGRGWIAVVTIEGDPRRTLHAYAEQLREADFDVRSVSAATCFQRWNGHESGTKESPLHAAVPSYATPIGSPECHVVGFRGSAAVSLNMTLRDGSPWAIRVERFRAIPQNRLAEMPDYAAPRGDLPVARRDARAHRELLRGLTPAPVAVQDGDRALLSDGQYVVPWGCYGEHLDVISTPDAPTAAMDRYVEHLTGMGMTLEARNDQLDESAARGVFTGGGPTIELRAGTHDGSTRLLLRGCRG